MATRNLITIERLKEVLSYDPQTGIFTSVVDRGPIRRGQKVGGPNAAGYTQLTIDGQFYLGHVLAWFYMTWQWPSRKIDHKNNTPGDDRFDNLRQATDSQNGFNRRVQSNNKSGYKGVALFKGDGIRQRPWCAEIQAHKKRVWMGYFSTAKEAADARAEKIKEFHGEFSRQ